MKKRTVKILQSKRSSRRIFSRLGVNFFNFLKKDNFCVVADRGDCGGAVAGTVLGLLTSRGDPLQSQRLLLGITS